MKSLVRSLCLFAIFLAFTSQAFAWGPEGHKMVGDIAEHFMTKAAKDSFAKYLGDTTVGQAAPWMDQIRKIPAYSMTGPWHYIDFEKGQDYHAAKDTNIYNELKIAIDHLEHRSTRTPLEIAFDLKVVVHLVGDMHMPLHVGYNSDRGGNDIKLKYLNQDTTRFGKPFNLHAIWDGDMIYTQHITLDKVLAEGASKYTEKQNKKIADPDFVEWMNESRAYLPNVYAFKPTGIDQEYVDANTGIIEDQIYRAGIRLAGLLNEVFAKK